MIRLSRLTDYAIVIVAELAREPGALQAAAGLSARTGIPEPTVAKVLKILARAEVVESARGVNGGYLVKRPSTEIRIVELIEAVNGPVALTACVDGGESDCCISSNCQLKGRWDPVNVAIRDAFKTVKLSDMIDPDHIPSACATCGAGVGS